MALCFQGAGITECGNLSSVGARALSNPRPAPVTFHPLFLIHLSTALLCGAKVGERQGRTRITDVTGPHICVIDLRTSAYFVSSTRVKANSESLEFMQLTQ